MKQSNRFGIGAISTVVPNAMGERQVTLPLPDVGYVEHISVPNGYDIAFQFNYNEASFARSGNDLYINFDDNRSLCLHDFFITDASSKLPEMVFEDGSKVNLGVFLSALGVDITTSIGPTAPLTGGVGEYGSDTGDLIAGVETLDSLTGLAMQKNQGSLATQMQGYVGESSTIAGLPDSGNTGNTGNDDGMSVQKLVDYHARAVLYTQNYYDSGAAPAKPVSPENYRLSIDLLNSDGSPVSAQEAHNAKLSLLMPTNAQEYFVVEGVSSGKILLHLTKAGLDALATGAPLYNYLQVSVNGQSHTVQLVGLSDNSFDSLHTNTDITSGGHLVGDKLIFGEWHSGQGMEAVRGQVNTINTSGLGDTFTLAAGMQTTGTDSINQVNLHTAVGKNAVLNITGGPANGSAMLATGNGENIIDGSLDGNSGGHHVGGATTVNLQGAHGLFAEAYGSNIIQHVNKVAIDGAKLSGMHSDTSSNTIAHIAGGVEITSAGTGMFALGGFNLIHTVSGSEGVVVSADKASGIAMHTESGQNTIHNLTRGNVELQGTIGMAATSSGNNSISQVAGKVSVHGKDMGLLAAQSGANSIFRVDKDVEVHSQGGAAMYADDGRNEIMQVKGNVTLKDATGDGMYTTNGTNTIADVSGSVILETSRGMFSEGGYNIITGVAGDVHISGGNPITAYKGGTNIVTAAGDIFITSGTDGLEAQGGTNTLTAGAGRQVNIQVEADKGLASGLALTYRDNDGGRPSLNTVGGAEGKNLADVNIAVHNNAKGDAYGFLGMVHGINKLAFTEDVNILVNRESGNDIIAGQGSGYGLYAFGGNNIIEKVTNVNLQVGSNGKEAVGVWAANGGYLNKYGNSVVAEGQVSIDVQGQGLACGLSAYHSLGGRYLENLVTGKEATSIAVTGKDAAGLYASGMFNANRIGLNIDGERAGDVNVKVVSAGSTHETNALLVEGAAQNAIYATGRVNIEASATKGAVFAVHGTVDNTLVGSGKNIIATTAQDQSGAPAVSILAADEQIYTTYKSAPAAIGLMADSYAINTVSASNSTVDIRATSHGGAVSGLRAEDGSNHITGQNVHVTATTDQVPWNAGPSYISAIGTFASVYGNNQMTVDNEFSITAKTSSLKDSAAGMQAMWNSSNTVEASNVSRGIEVRITAESGAINKAFAMLAIGSGALNQILGANHADGHDYIALKGIIEASGGGSNVISTGAGNDVIDLDGRVIQGSLTIEAGPGFDVLILRASNIGEFSTRYQSWLEHMDISKMGIEEVRVSIGYDASVDEHVDLGTKLSWLEGLFKDSVVYDLQIHGDFGAEGGNHALLAGGGDDVVTVGGVLHSSMHLGDGNDWAILGGLGAEGVLDGGSGNDTLQLNLQDTAALGTQYHFEGIKNIENLWLNLGNGNADVIDTDFVSQSFQALQGMKEVHMLVDKDDVLNLGDSWKKVEGNSYSANDQTGNNVHFDTYQQDTGTEVLTLYIQNLVG